MQSTFRRGVVASILGLISIAILVAAAAPAAEQDGVAVWFSPDGGCAEVVVDAIDNATRSLDVAIYHLTHPEIARAIANAHRRRVTVRVLMDRSQSQANYSAARYLDNNRVPVRIWNKGMMHHKFIVIDRRHVITGSFNFTKSADTSNAENLLLLRDKARLADEYVRQFQALLRDSGAYAPPKG